MCYCECFTVIYKIWTTLFQKSTLLLSGRKNVLFDTDPFPETVHLLTNKITQKVLNQS